MRPIVPAAGLALASLGSNAAGAAFGLAGDLSVLVALTGMGSSLGALAVLHTQSRLAHHTPNERRAAFRRRAEQSRHMLRLLQTCTDEELVRLRELRRQVRHGERSEFF